MNAMLQPLNLKPNRHTDTAQYIKLNSISDPVYLFSDTLLKERVAEFNCLFDGELSYAMKANPETLLLDCLWNSGVKSFDVASIGEIAIISSRFKGAHCHYNNPVRSDDMTSLAAYKYGVRSFAVDDLAGLNQVAALDLSDVEVSVRFKLDFHDAAYDFGSKFGADIEQATEILKRANELGMRCSLTFHPGSQCADSTMYAEHIKAAAKISQTADVKLHRLNVGGGFPLPYQNTQLDSLDQYMRAIHRAVKVNFGDDAPALLCEPGRALVGTCTSLLSQVIRVRENGNVFINDGIYGGFQEQMFAELDLPYRVSRGDKLIFNSLQGNQNFIETTVFGPTCDPVDKLPNKIALPLDIREGGFYRIWIDGCVWISYSNSF